ncbi:hypothetical protein EJ110_NYTH28341 [Nymphaea thermarum]|nr:hypothetical protein EJ110_NYTH28341 [Nymphaea thermarum]
MDFGMRYPKSSVEDPHNLALWLKCTFVACEPDHLVCSMVSLSSSTIFNMATCNSSDHLGQSSGRIQDLFLEDVQCLNCGVAGTLKLHQNDGALLEHGSISLFLCLGSTKMNGTDFRMVRGTNGGARTKQSICSWFDPSAELSFSSFDGRCKIFSTTMARHQKDNDKKDKKDSHEVIIKLAAKFKWQQCPKFSATNVEYDGRITNDVNPDKIRHHHDVGMI